MEHGEFASGVLSQISPDGNGITLRIDLFDEIDSIRRFDPKLSAGCNVKRSSVSAWFPLDEPGVMQLKRFRERFDVDIRQCPIYQDVAMALLPRTGILLDVFFEKLDSLFDFAR